VGTASTCFPVGDQSYATDERPPGILFYRGRESFFLPYHLLQTMSFRTDEIHLTFAADDLVITGRGLHELYVQLATQRVSRIVAADDRHAAISEAVVLVTSIERTARSREEIQQQPGTD
jgi:hypothetical protein